jgi:hypothetical protein
MAKHVIQELYTFTPSTKTIVVTNKLIRPEQLMLITNVTRNTVMYNFSDPTLGATITSSTSNATGQVVISTTIVLNYNTAAHSSTDKISILVEETNETFKPTEELSDPVGKLRTSSPQALIDTDFEYSTQSTKWESVALVNNRPFAYYNVTAPITITNITATNGSRSITVATTTPPAAGSPVFIQETTWSGADGLYIVDTVSAGVSFTYTARIPFTGTTGTIYTAGSSSVFQGYVYTGASIGAAGTATFTPGTGTAVAVVTAIPHGLVVGNEIGVTGITGTNPPNGSWVVATVTSPTAFTFYANAAASGLTVSSGLIYVRPQGNFLHRSYDGGIFFSTNAASHNHQLVRQTRRYFRYQSGKGLQMSTGTLLKPSIEVDQITSSGTLVTVTTKFIHNIQPGTVITVGNCNESAYNGSFTVINVISNYQFTYTAASAPSATPASGLYTLSVSGWYGSSTRIGMFDSQNGLFFEFDGQTLYAVRRSSTYQISGFVNATAGSSTITGATNNGVATVFSKQLVPGDFIVIKGMSYRVDSIASDTSMTIIPAYRGSANLTNAIVSKTVDVKIPQSQWNIDRFDGTGPSGLNLDLNRMQMFYMDYSWYGAGFVRWGFRGLDGNVYYGNKFVNNNINYQAYMRSGNLPARYETNTFGKLTTLTASVGVSDTTVNVASTAGWPSSGTALIRSSTAYEYVNFTGITSTSLTGVTRGQAGNTALTATTITANSNTILLASTTGVQIGQFVNGTGIPAGAFIISFVPNTSLTISMAATASGSSVSLVLAPLGLTAQAFTYTTTSPIAVELHSPQFASTISHWGTSVIMDGRFDDDKSFVFTKGMTTTLAVASSANNALMSFRIAPSVSNGITGTTLGSRELVNRMQMVLRQMDIFSNGQFLITIVLNGTVSSATPNWSSVGGSSLAQSIAHTSTTTITGGETIFGFFINTSGGTNYSTTQQELNLVRDMGTSILAGGVAAANTGVYPDGPDMVTIMAQNIGASSGNIFARLSWTEAQA